MKKIARKERQHSDDENDNNFTHKFPCHPCRKKGQTNVLHPAVILMIL